MHILHKEQAMYTEQTELLSASFPRKYIHCAFNTIQDSMQALFTLIAAGYNSSDMHILASQDYIEALEQRRTIFSFLTSMEFNEYVYEAKQGRSILVIRPESYLHLTHIRRLLIPHRARLMKYIDTWTTTELL